jgi:AcrR family transcriptional regulator
MAQETNSLFAELFPELSARSQKKRVEIIEAAIQQIADAGIESITFDSIAARIQTNRAHVRYHYQDLDDVLADCMRLVTVVAQKETILRLKSASDWKEQVQAMIHGALHHYELHPAHAIVMMSFYARSCTNAKYSELYMRIRTAGRQRIALILEPIFGTTTTQRELAETLAQGFQNLVFGHIFDRTASRQRQPFQLFQQKVWDEARELLSFYIRRTL